MVPKKKKKKKEEESKYSAAQPIRVLQFKGERERVTELETRIKRERDITHFHFIFFISVCERVRE